MCNARARRKPAVFTPSTMLAKLSGNAEIIRSVFEMQAQRLA
jgi:hypothetical protein